MTLVLQPVSLRPVPPSPACLACLPTPQRRQAAGRPRLRRAGRVSPFDGFDKLTASKLRAGDPGYKLPPAADKIASCVVSFNN
jgi:hypothetical protein